ncbi:MAG: AAA family ATPase [Myxococcota bacterium]
MYTAFYGLREKPFALSPDPRFLYLAASHREALAHLLYGIEQGEGFISVTGEVGTGKTTLCRTLLERLEGGIEVAFLFNPSRSALELLQSICAEFGLPAEGLGRRNLMSQLNKFLLEQKERGRRVLLIIDEAQTLSENTLEQVRLLSNLETSREKLIQILLLGQPELDRKLDERGLRQLRQRISVRWKLEPLGAEETVAYVRHRIAVAARQPKEIFTESALREVHRRTGGIPRLVNQLCDRALLAGYAARAAQIGPALIRTAAREIPDVRDPWDRDPRLGRPLLPGWMKRPWMYFAMTLVVVAAALLAGLVVGRSGVVGGGGGGGRVDFGGDAAGAGAMPAVSARADGRSATAAGLASASRSGVGGTPEGVVFQAAGFDPRRDPGLALPPLGRLIGYVGEDGLPIPGAADARLAVAGLDASTLPVISRSAVAPGALSQLLSERTGRDALAESERAFLDLYDLSPEHADLAVDRRAAAAKGGQSPPATAEDLARRLEQRGLMTTAFDGGSLSMLRRLDHPVLIPLALEPSIAPAAAVAETDRRWLALTGFDGDRAWLAGLVPARVVSVALEELEPHWLEAGVIVWQNHERLAARFERDGPRASVRWLQEALAELGYLVPEAGAPTGEFDSATAASLRAFQSANDIVEDGVVGPLTQIALYGRLDRYPVPRLSLASVRPMPSPLATDGAPPVSAAPRVGVASPTSAAPRVGVASPTSAAPRVGVASPTSAAPRADATHPAAPNAAPRPPSDPSPPGARG